MTREEKEKSIKGGGEDEGTSGEREEEYIGRGRWRGRRGMGDEYGRGGGRKERATQHCSERALITAGGARTPGVR